jgi:hypothetical protein
MAKDRDEPEQDAGEKGKVAGFLIPPDSRQVVDFDFNTLLSYGQLTPEVLEALTGLLAALQKSFLEAQAGGNEPGFTFDACPPRCSSHGGCDEHCGLGGCPPQCIHHFDEVLEA